MTSIENMKLNEIIQYENNPRNNDGAVDKVAESIKEFGIKVPIIVDKCNVIIAGHIITPNNIILLHIFIGNIIHV